MAKKTNADETLVELSEISTPVKERPGHLWKPGQSGNPGGRHTAFAEFQKAIREEFLPLAKTALRELLNHEDGKVRAMAMKEVFDRAFGKAPQAITGENGEPIKVLSVIVLPSESES